MVGCIVTPVVDELQHSCKCARNLILVCVCSDSSEVSCGCLDAALHPANIYVLSKRVQESWPTLDLKSAYRWGQHMACFTEAPNDALLVMQDIKVAACLLLIQNRINLGAPAE